MAPRSGRTFLVLLTLLSAQLVLSPGPAEAAPTCFGKKATPGIQRGYDQQWDYWIGTPKADVIIIPDYRTKGTDGVWADGLGGDDLICGGLHHYSRHIGGLQEERLFGSAGNDRIRLDDDEDSADGGDGNDTLIAGKGGSSLIGGKGDDRLEGGAGEDEMYGEAGRHDTKSVTGAIAGKDVLLGGPGDDYLDGQGGDDELDAGTGRDELLGSQGNDILRSTAADGQGDTVDGYDGDDVLLDGSAGSTLTGGRGRDQIHGGDGDDEIFADCESDYACQGGGALPDFIDAGPGNDGIDAGQNEMEGDEIHAGPGDDFVEGHGPSAQILGEEGDDELWGSFSSAVDGGPGHDYLRQSPECVDGERFDDCDTVIGGDSIDLRTWTQEGDKTADNFPDWVFPPYTPPLGNWVRADPDEYFTPSFLLGPDTYSTVTVKGYGGSESKGPGYAGLVLGYNAPSGGSKGSCGAGPCQLDMVLLDWGTGDETSPNGMSLVRVNGTFNLRGEASLNDSFWMHGDSASFDVLATQPKVAALEGGYGLFTVMYSPTRVLVTVRNSAYKTSTVLDVSGTFPSGRVGLYHNGRSSTYYAIATYP